MQESLGGTWEERETTSSRFILEWIMYEDPLAIELLKDSSESQSSHPIFLKELLLEQQFSVVEYLLNGPCNVAKKSSSAAE